MNRCTTFPKYDNWYVLDNIILYTNNKQDILLSLSSWDTTLLKERDSVREYVVISGIIYSYYDMKLDNIFLRYNSLKRNRERDSMLLFPVLHVSTVWV